MLDINKFKYFNDTFGHKKGDEILCLVSDILTKVLAGCDVFRYGGDEFLVVGKEISEADLGEKLAECSSLLGQYSTDKGRPELSFSCEVVGLKASDANYVYDAISKADMLLYENKRKVR